MSQPQAAAARAQTLPSALLGLCSLAALLERIERAGQRPDPAQYRLLVARIREQLHDASTQPGFETLLAAFPATADLYENLRYEWAGLCRAPLAQSVGSERQARELLSRIARKPPVKY